MRTLTCILISLFMVGVSNASFNDIYNVWKTYDFNSYEVSYNADIVKGSTPADFASSVTHYVDANSFVVDACSGTESDFESGWHRFDGKVHEVYRRTKDGAASGKRKYSELKSAWDFNAFATMLGLGEAFWMGKSKTERYSVMEAFSVVENLDDGNIYAPRLIQQ